MAERQHSDLVARRLAAIVDNYELLEGVDSHVEICIIDTGEGISPEFLPRSYGGDPGRLSESSTEARQNFWQWYIAWRLGGQDAHRLSRRRAS